MATSTMDVLPIVNKAGILDGFQQLGRLQREYSSYISSSFSPSCTGELTRRIGCTTLYGESTATGRDRVKDARIAIRMAEIFSSVRESILNCDEALQPLYPTMQVATPASETEWSQLQEEFGPPDYEKMSQDLRAYLAERGRNLDELLHKASVHFKTEQPPIRQRPLNPEEIQKMVQEENEAFNG